MSWIGPVPLSRNGRADAKGLPAEPSTELARLALQAGLPAWNTRRIPVRRWPTQAPRTPRPGDAKQFEVIGIPLPQPGFHVVEVVSPRLGQALLKDGKPYH
ncbi:MAG TPA: hypothetical protein PLY50_16555, partial [Burkholderiaceae bacterium]|nr:hypothetical protein [Burkholderiaceae bacterium]